jgi:hypothetical protein
MDFPPKARIKKMTGGLLKTTWLRTTVFVLLCDREYRDRQIKELLEGPREKLSKVSVTQVKFGNVHGVRRFVDLSVVESMSVDYALEVPGGFAMVALLKKGTENDTSQFEQFFHTIRIV